MTDEHDALSAPIEFRLGTDGVLYIRFGGEWFAPDVTAEAATPIHDQLTRERQKKEKRP